MADLRLRARLAGALVAAAAAGLALPAGARSEPPYSVDYLYIQANEGDASGGHAAFRIGDWTYHFQHEDGLLRMRRDLWSRFQHVYRSLENRGIAVSRIPVSQETWERLRHGFQRRYLVQSRRLELLADLERDADLLAALLAGARGAPQGFALRGAGFFAAAPAPGPALDALRERIAALHGPDFLAARRRALAEGLAALRPAAPEPQAVLLAPGRYPSGFDSFSGRYAELWSGLAAVALLEQPRALSDGLLLDALPGDAEVLELDARRRAALPQLAAEAEGDWRRARARALGAEEFRELDWSELELAAGRRAELQRARAGAPVLRVHQGPALPEGRALVHDLPLPALPPAELAAQLEHTRAAARRFREALEAEQGYNLITHNCVSEIFHTIDAALAGDGVSAAAASERRLGGHVEPLAGLNFIPFVSSRQVRARYGVGEARWLPSYRRFQLEVMARHEPAWRVALRESNVFSSTLYEPSARDGFFVFFTDGPAALRPLLGAGNLIGALGWSGVGLALLPLDRGRTLRAGLEGALFSLPELAFVNLRKGSNEYVPPALQPPPG